MNILYIHRTRGGGVEGVHINGIIDSFESLGHSVDVLSPESESDTENEVKADKSENETRPGLKSRFFSWLSGNVPELIFEFAELAYNFVAYKGAKGLVAAKHIDFIYERYAIFAFIGALMANKRNIPLVLEINYTSMSPLVRERSVLMAPFAKKMDTWMFKQASCLSVVSSYLKDHLVKDFGVSEDKIIVVPNAADPKTFFPQDESLSLRKELNIEGKTVIGFVGGFYPWHGVSLLIEAFAELQKQYPETALLLVGDGPEREHIQQRVNALQLDRNVVFTGKVSHEKLPDLISLFEMGVMPDSNLYGSPMKIFEYMALGKPVVVPDYGPLLDVVTPSKQGVIFERNNVGSLRDALASLVGNPELSKAMAHEARLSIETEHNWLANAQKNLDFISSYCGNEL